MEAKYHDDLPGNTLACLDPRHDDPCVGDCPGCNEECDPAFRTTLAEVRRRAETDQWLREIGARVIQVKDLGAALEARAQGAYTVGLATRPLSAPPWPTGQPDSSSLRCIRNWASEATSLARLALGER